jgi:nitrogen regulatory protein P-II 1
MKKIEAIIRESAFESVKEALHAIDINFFTYIECKGVGNQKASNRVYRGAVCASEFINRYELTIIVNDIDLRKTINCILDAAYTGEVGDGKIFVSTIDESWTIRTKENGDDSILQKHRLEYDHV